MVVKFLKGHEFRDVYVKLCEIVKLLKFMWGQNLWQICYKSDIRVLSQTKLELREKNLSISILNLSTTD